ncbi:hypothetical protein OIU85_029355 [Salix viminalis]|uniref:Uncharacterized protein n=1 Tax=Salix viminalis TaxID=40686 RepID=A0A9Q0T7J2_SALVM|nr:hypothetical protein OIU85_029355 [Salix viminalis]
MDSPGSEDVNSTGMSPSAEQGNLSAEDSDFPDEALQGPESILEGGDYSSVVTSEDGFAGDMESTDSDSSEEPEIANSFPATEFTGENDCDLPSRENSSPFETKSRVILLKDEGFATWQRTMCVDAVRANGEWIMYILSISGSRIRDEGTTIG